MNTSIGQGSFQFTPQKAGLPPSSVSDMNSAVEALRQSKKAWADLSVLQRIVIIDELMSDIRSTADRWASSATEAKGITVDGIVASEEWLAGPYFTMVILRQFRRSLLEIERFGHPRVRGPIMTRPDGRVVAQVFPKRIYDRIFYKGFTGEVWMQPGVSADGLSSTQAVKYHGDKGPGKIALVLGAGNVSSIGPLDIVNKLFLENQVVLYKTNPVNDYLGPIFTQSFRALIDRGFLRIVYGGSQEGAYLCNHSEIDEIHITGSDKTFDSILFGTGTEGIERKARKEPLLKKRVTGELGNVSPLIVIPGVWNEDELSYHAEHIATTLANNAGFNCNATRVIIQHAEWDQRRVLLDHARRVLANVPARNAYYPGAVQRFDAFLTAHPEAERIGTPEEGQLPWVLASSLDPFKENDVWFKTEAFCGIMGETALSAKSIPEYIDSAVSFANNTLWGTLNATILVHPLSLRDPAVADAVERAITNLRYGAIGINIWAAVSFGLGVTTWGAYPGSPPDNIQSGVGCVHNTLMFDRVEKSVIRAPFVVRPTPSWFVTRGKIGVELHKKLVEFEAAPSPFKVPGLLRTAMKKP